MNGTTVQDTTIIDKIKNALDGRSQVWLVEKINDYAETLPDSLEKEFLRKFNSVRLSRKMNGNDLFEGYELKAISKILKIKL